MIKWTLKSKTDSDAGKNTFYYSKNGICIKIQKYGILENYDEWSLDIYCYTDGLKEDIYTTNFKTRHNSNPRVYEHNAKDRASRVAKKVLGKYTNRITKFVESIEA